MAKIIEKTDGAALIVMALGALNSGLIGLAKLNAISRVFGRKAIMMRGAYAFIGLSAIYKLLRLLMPKTKHQLRMQRIDQVLSRLEQAEKSAKQYIKAAEAYKQRMKKMKRTSLAA